MFLYWWIPSILHSYGFPKAIVFGSTWFIYLFIYLFYHNGKFEICGYFGSDDKEKKKKRLIGIMFSL
jgi:hypothetical protein